MIRDFANVRPKVSIIVAVYNRVAEISECLDSVIGQSFKSWELVVIDGGSNDGTVEVINAYAEHIRYFHTGPDSGIASAWNHALEHVSGEWYLFLGSDDRLHDKDVLQTASYNFDDQDYHFIYGSVTFVGSLNNQIIGEEFDRDKLKRRMTIPHMACFHSSVIFENFRFNERLSISIDYHLMIQNLDKMFRYIDVPITIAGANGVSITETFTALNENFSIQKESTEIPFYFPYCLLVYYTARERIRKFVQLFRVLL